MPIFPPKQWSHSLSQLQQSNANRKNIWAHRVACPLLSQLWRFKFLFLFSQHEPLGRNSLQKWNFRNYPWFWFAACFSINWKTLLASVSLSVHMQVWIRRRWRRGNLAAPGFWTKHCAWTIQYDFWFLCIHNRSKWPQRSILDQLWTYRCVKIPFCELFLQQGGANCPCCKCRNSPKPKFWWNREKRKEK